MGGLKFNKLQSQGLVCLSAAINVVKKIDYFPPPVKGSKRKGARTKCSRRPLETSKPERSAQAAVAMKGNVTIAKRSQNPQRWIIPKRQNCISLLPTSESKSQAAGGAALLRKQPSGAQGCWNPALSPQPRIKLPFHCQCSVSKHFKTTIASHSCIALTKANLSIKICFR